jgi:hypothetical protein
MKGKFLPYKLIGDVAYPMSPSFILHSKVKKRIASVQESLEFHLVKHMHVG